MIENGRVIFQDIDRGFVTDVQSVRGNVVYVARRDRIGASIQARTKGSDRRNLRFEGGYEAGTGVFSGVLELKDEKISEWMDYADGAVTASSATGTFDLMLSARGKEFSAEKMKTGGSLFVKNGGVTFTGGAQLKEVRSDILLNDGNITVNGIAFKMFGGDGLIKGSVKDAFRSGKLSLSAELKGAGLREAAGSALEGKAGISAAVSGDYSKPILTGAFKWEEGKLYGISAENIEAAVIYGNNEFEVRDIKGRLGGGGLKGGFSVKEAKGRKELRGRIEAPGVSLEGMINGGDAGRASFVFRASGTVEKPGIGVSVKSDRINFSDNKVTKLNADLRADGEDITASGNFGFNGYERLDLNAGAQLKNGVLSLKNAVINDGVRNIVSLKGAFGSRDRAISLEALVNMLDIEKAGTVFISEKDIKGSVSGSFEAKGSADKPVIKALVDTQNIIIRGKKHYLKGALSYGHGNLEVSGFDFNNNVVGRGEFSVENKIFGMAVDIRDFGGYVMKELTGFEFFENAVLNGTADIKKEADGYGGSAAVRGAYSKGLYKGFKLEFRGERNDFILSDFGITQERGFLKAGGSLTVRNEQDVTADIKGEFRKYEFNKKAVVDGVFETGAQLIFSAEEPYADIKASMSAAEINGQKEPGGYFSARITGNEVKSFDFKWGQSYSAKGSVGAGRGGRINIIADLNDADLYPLYTLVMKQDRRLEREALLKGRFEVSGPAENARVTAVVSQAKGSVAAKGNLSFGKKGLLAIPDRMNIEYSLINADLENMGRVFDGEFRDKGTINASGTLKGRADNPESEGNLMMTSGSVMGIQYDSLSADYVLKNKRLDISRMSSDYRGSRLAITGSFIEKRQEGSYYAAIKTNMRDFEWEGNRFNGGVDFFGRIETGNRLRVDGSISSENFGFRKHLFSPFVLKVDVNGDNIELKTSKGRSVVDALIINEKERIVFERLSVADENGIRSLGAKGVLRKKTGESDLSFDADRANPQMISRLLDWDNSWGGELGGTVKISGNQEKGLVYTINVNVRNGTIDGIEYDLFGGLLIIKDDWIDLAPVTPLKLTKEGKYTVLARGKIPVPMTAEADERLKGVPMEVRASMKDGDLSIIKFLDWIDDAGGPAEADIVITGTKEFPSVDGKIEITGGAARIKYLFGNLENVYGNILIKDNIIDIYTLRGDTRKGTLKVANLDEKKGGVMKWMKPHEVNWKVTNIGDVVRFSDTPFMEMLEGDAELDLDITGLLDSPNISGSMKASNMKVRFPVRMKTRAGEITEIEDNYAKKINWNVRIDIGENVYYYNDYFNNYAEVFLRPGSGPVNITGRGNDMRINGTVFIARGVYKYMNTEFRVDDMKESRVVFDGQEVPVLDVSAVSKIRRIEMAEDGGRPRDIDIYMRAWGRVGALNIDLSSEPSYDRNRLLYVLTFGKDTDKSVDAGDAYKMADALANSWIKGRTEEIKRFTPLDVLAVKVTDIVPREQVTPESGVTPSAKTRLELGLGKYLTEDLYFDYNVRLLEGVGIYDPAMSLNLEHTLGLQYSLGQTTKFVFEGIFRDPNFYSNQFEGFMGIENRWSFGGWGEEKKPTPVPTTSR